MTTIHYLDFDLYIEPHSRSRSRLYRAHVLNSPAGQASVDFKLPFSKVELENYILKIGRTRQGMRSLNSPEGVAAREFGYKLFNAIFQDQVRDCLRRSLDVTQQSGYGLRIRLRLTEAQGLTSVPWEYLYDAPYKRFFSHSQKTPIIRYFELPEAVHPLTVQLPLNLLIMIANPRDYMQLNVEEEWRKIQNSLSDLNQRRLITITRLEKATLNALQRQLRHKNYHIFHFIGHGGFDQQMKEGVLLLEDDSGLLRKVAGSYLATLFHDHPTLQLAVLNACEGARTDPFDPFAGIAQTFVQQGIPAVIAMQFEITDRSAITLAHEFYTALADGYPVDAALAEARKAIFADGNDVEWGTPVLYMRSPNGQIFDLTVQEQRAEGSEQLEPIPDQRTESVQKGLSEPGEKELEQFGPVSHPVESEQLEPLLDQSITDSAQEGLSELGGKELEQSEQVSTPIESKQLEPIHDQGTKSVQKGLSEPGEKELEQFGPVSHPVESKQLEPIPNQSITDSVQASKPFQNKKKQILLSFGLVLLIIAIIFLYQRFAYLQGVIPPLSATPIATTTPVTFPTTKIRIRLISTSDWSIVRVASPIITGHTTISRSGQPRASFLDGMALRLTQSLQQANDANAMEIIEEIKLAKLSEEHPLALAITMGCIGKTVVEVFNSTGSIPILVARHLTDKCPQTIDYFNVDTALLLTLTPTPLPTLHPNEIDFLRGSSFLDQLKYSQALALFNIAASSSWKKPELFLLRGIACIELAKISEECSLDKALADFNYAIELDPDNSEVYHRRATVLMEQGKLADAVTDLVRAIALKPDNPSLYLARALVYIKSNNTTQALQDIDKAIEADPTSYKPYLLQGKIYSEQLKDSNKASEAYNKAVELCPKIDPTAYFERGIYYQQLQNWEAVIADMTQASLIYPDSPDPYGHRGDAYVRLNDIAKAREDYSKFLELTDGKSFYASWRKIVEEWMSTH
jgi:tetratricopeptide (TPR) repeat protein